MKRFGRFLEEEGGENNDVGSIIGMVVLFLLSGGVLLFGLAYVVAFVLRQRRWRNNAPHIKKRPWFARATEGDEIELKAGFIYDDQSPEDDQSAVDAYELQRTYSVCSTNEADIMQYDSQDEDYATEPFAIAIGEFCTRRSTVQASELVMEDEAQFQNSRLQESELVVDDEVPVSKARLQESNLVVDNSVPETKTRLQESELILDEEIPVATARLQESNPKLSGDVKVSTVRIQESTDTISPGSKEGAVAGLKSNIEKMYDRAISECSPKFPSSKTIENAHEEQVANTPSLYLSRNEDSLLGKKAVDQKEFKDELEMQCANLDTNDCKFKISDSLKLESKTTVLPVSREEVVDSESEKKDSGIITQGDTSKSLHPEAFECHQSFQGTTCGAQQAYYNNSMLVEMSDDDSIYSRESDNASETMDAIHIERVSSRDFADQLGKSEESSTSTDWEDQLSWSREGSLVFHEETTPGEVPNRQAPEEEEVPEGYPSDNVENTTRKCSEKLLQGPSVSHTKAQDKPGYKSSNSMHSSNSPASIGPTVLTERSYSHV